MRTHLLLMIAVLCFSVAGAEPVKVGDTKITFEPPANFKPVPKEIIDLKWPSDRAPRYVVGNESATTTVAYDIKPHQIPQDKLGEVQTTFTRLFNQIIPGIEWKSNEIIEHSGQKWLLLEMTSRAIDTDIHNIMLVTGYQGKMLVFNFNSTKEEFSRFEKELRASLKSIKLPNSGETAERDPE